MSYRSLGLTSSKDYEALLATINEFNEAEKNAEGYEAAENDSEVVGLAQGHWSDCFFCLNGIEQAKANRFLSDGWPILDASESDCLKAMRAADDEEKRSNEEPKLTFPDDEKIPFEH